AGFVQPVRPGDRLDVVVDAVVVADDAARVSGTARVGPRKVASAEILYALLDVAQAGERIDGAGIAALHSWSDRIWRRLLGAPQGRIGTGAASWSRGSGQSHRWDRRSNARGRGWSRGARASTTSAASMRAASPPRSAPKCATWTRRVSPTTVKFAASSIV